MIPTSGATRQGYHAIADFLRCPKLDQFKRVRGIALPGTETPDYFAVGIMVHAGRAEWLEGGGTDAAAEARIHAVMEQSAIQEKLPITEKARRDAYRYVAEYIEHWSTRVGPKVVAVEYALDATPLVPGDPDFWKRTARLDDVSFYPEALDQLCVGELKTTSHSIADCANQYTLHGQPLLQMALWQRATNGAAKHGAVAGVLLDVIKKGYGKERSQFGRHFIPVEDFAVAWFIRSIRGYLKAQSKVEWNTEVPRNPNGCTYVSSGRRATCECRDLCIAGRSAAGKYWVNGQPMRLWRPEPGKEVAPWE
jgi:hypothetical protein